MASTSISDLASMKEAEEAARRKQREIKNTKVTEREERKRKREDEAEAAGVKAKKSRAQRVEEATLEAVAVQKETCVKHIDLMSHMLEELKQQGKMNAKVAHAIIGDEIDSDGE